MNVVGIFTPMTRGGNIWVGHPSAVRAAPVCSITLEADPRSLYFVLADGRVAHESCVPSDVANDWLRRLCGTWGKTPWADLLDCPETLAWLRSTDPAVLPPDLVNAVRHDTWVAPQHRWLGRLAADTKAEFDRLARAKEDRKATHAHLGYVGTVGVRQVLAVRVVEIRSLGTVESEFKTEERFLVKMVELGTGNHLVWWTGENLALEDGFEGELAATVIKHEEYNDCPVTTVNRVSEKIPETLKKKGGK